MKQCDAFPPVFSSSFGYNLAGNDQEAQVGARRVLRRVKNSIRAARILAALAMAIGSVAICSLSMARVEARSRVQWAFSSDDRADRRLWATQSVAATINLNLASWSELKTLPGVDDNVALKLMRARSQTPLRALEDLARAPWLEPPQRARLLATFRNRVSF
ncbi:MAG: helix-hairpin-helix domain-containing protein [Vampirovibrionales bacterium]|nr:helix-hairpin-helix domain-containing protein [Vampirovibrionales bacterium]